MENRAKFESTQTQSQSKPKASNRTSLAKLPKISDIASKFDSAESNDVNKLQNIKFKINTTGDVGLQDRSENGLIRSSSPVLSKSVTVTKKTVTKSNNGTSISQTFQSRTVKSTEHSNSSSRSNSPNLSQSRLVKIERVSKQNTASSYDSSASDVSDTNSPRDIPVATASSLKEQLQKYHSGSCKENSNDKTTTSSNISSSVQNGGETTKHTTNTRKFEVRNNRNILKQKAEAEKSTTQWNVKLKKTTDMPPEEVTSHRYRDIEAKIREEKTKLQRKGNIASGGNSEHSDESLPSKYSQFERKKSKERLDIAKAMWKQRETGNVDSILEESGDAKKVAARRTLDSVLTKRTTTEHQLAPRSAKSLDNLLSRTSSTELKANNSMSSSRTSQNDVKVTTEVVLRRTSSGTSETASEKREKHLSRKISADQFQKIKCGFEKSDSSLEVSKGNTEQKLHGKISAALKSFEDKGIKPDINLNKPKISKTQSVDDKNMNSQQSDNQNNTETNDMLQIIEGSSLSSDPVIYDDLDGHEYELEELEGDYSGTEGIYEDVTDIVAKSKGNEKKGGVFGNRRFALRSSINKRLRRSRKDKTDDQNEESSKSKKKQKKAKVHSSESDTDSEGSGIYEPVDHYDFEEPADVETKKKKDKSGEKNYAGLGTKLKNFYKGKADTVGKSLGGKLKFKKKPKSFDTNLCDSPDESELFYSDVRDEVPDGVIYYSGDSVDSSDLKMEDTPPPMLPPKNAPKLQTAIDSRGGESPPPPPPPRMSHPVPMDSVSMPPLPPRNKKMEDINLNTVIPVSKGGQWHATKDSYLHGQQLSTEDKTNNDHVVLRKSPIPPGDGYIGPNPPSPRLPKNRNSKLRSSSPHLESEDISSSPKRDTASIDKLIQFSSKLNDDEGIYIDMDEDQLYGSFKGRISTKFDDQPLYQIYNKATMLRQSQKSYATSTSSCDSDDEPDDDDSESTGDHGIYEAVYDALAKEIHEGNESDSPTHTAKLWSLERVHKPGSSLRMLWCEMPEVIESGILDKIDSGERRIQEAMFELITSEASYLKSLNVLINVFLMSQEFSSELSDRCVVTRQERHVLFSNIGSVRDTSERLLSDLEKRWQQAPVINDICDILHEHAKSEFEVYVRYCSNQTFQERTLENLIKRIDVKEAVRRLERNPECQGLPFPSFLLLPMQRITRLPLLVDAFCRKLEPATPRQQSALQALETLNKVVKKCNDGARKMQQTEQMYFIAQQLEFKVREIPLISASRFLVKQGELVRIVNDSSSILPFGKDKASKQKIYAYLFSDYLLLTKKKSNTSYVVFDYCQRNALHVECLDNPEKSKYLPLGIPSGCKNLFLLVMLENCEQKQVQMVLSCNSPSDRTRWVEGLAPQPQKSDTEKIYEEWDCPQVQAVQKYVAQEPDELSLEETDVVNVLKKMADGWYEGERIRDGERGWFPANHTEEIVSAHVRARNLRLRYRLLAASENYVKAPPIKGAK